MLSIVVTDILTTYAEVIIGVGSCHHLTPMLSSIEVIEMSVTAMNKSPSPSYLHSFNMIKYYFDPLTSKSDWHQISPYNIIPESHVKVTRIKEMITNLRGS